MIATKRMLAGPALALFSVLAGAQDVPAKQLMLNIEAQSMIDALNGWAQQTGLQIIVPEAGATDRLQAPSVKGRFTAREALNELLQGTPLTYEFVNERTVVVQEKKRPASRQNAAGASPPAKQLHNVSQIEQSRPAPAAAPKNSSENSESSDARTRVGLEHVIVTAQKRSTSIEDTPISLAVLTSASIEQRGLVNAEDYLRSVPGVNQVDAVNGQAIVIRGMETSPNAQNNTLGSTVATYFGETPTTGTAGLGGGSNVDLKLVDIERVEILRGPQGTAFGSSSMSGVVRTIPVAPKLDEFEAKIAGGYSATAGSGGDNYNYHAMVNAPLAMDKLAIRATAYQFKDSGFYTNLAGSDPAFQSAVVTRYGAQDFAIDEDEIGSYDAAGGRIAGTLKVSDDLKFMLSYVYQKTEADAAAVATSGTYKQTVLQVAPEHVVRGQRKGIFDTDIAIANATVEYDMGWAELLGTYSYTDSGSLRATPFTSAVGLNFPISNLADSDHRQHVGEVRLVSQLDGAWNFLAGLYLEDIEDSFVNDVMWYGTPATNPFAPGQRVLGLFLDDRSLKQNAFFSEVSWEFLRNLTLTGGVRAYEYDRTFVNDAVGPLYGANGIHVNEESDASGTNLRGNLSYELDSGALFYASWSQGFRLGLPQQGLAAGLCDANGDGLVDGTNISTASTSELKSDAVDSYELGTKISLLDRRVAIDVAVFRMEWSDIPVRVTLGTAPSCGLPSVRNAGEALSEGVEFQLSFQATEGLRLDLGASWIDARLAKDARALPGSPRKGARLPGSPKVSANLSAQYEFDVAGYNTFVRTDSSYSGEFYGDLLESPFTRTGNYVKVDASLGVELGATKVNLFVRNLTNEDAFTYRNGVTATYGYLMRPRTVGINLDYAF